MTDIQLSVSSNGSRGSRPTPVPVAAFTPPEAFSILQRIEGVATGCARQMTPTVYAFSILQRIEGVATGTMGRAVSPAMKTLSVSSNGSRGSRRSFMSRAAVGNLSLSVSSNGSRGSRRHRLENHNLQILANTFSILQRIEGVATQVPTPVRVLL